MVKREGRVFMMVEFQSFKVSEFKGFRVPEFQCFSVSELPDSGIRAISIQRSALSFPSGQRTCPDAVGQACTDKCYFVSGLGGVYPAICGLRYDLHYLHDLSILLSWVLGLGSWVFYPGLFPADIHPSYPASDCG